MKNSNFRKAAMILEAVLMLFVLVGCYSTVDNRTKLGPATSSSTVDFEKLMSVQGLPTKSMSDSGSERPFPKVEQSWSDPVGRELLPKPNPYGNRPLPGATPRYTAPSSSGYTSSREAKQSGIFYSQAEELWIISRPKAVAQVYDDQYPGTGAMVVKGKVEAEEKEIPLPLKHTDVKAKVNGYIATVEVTQQFHNPYDSKIEAVYVFPLPENSAVNEFIMIVGERQIRGIIREREEAERIYKEARSQG